jgi:photosystem II stability/assembly factor-like uncharacterized protein
MQESSVRRAARAARVSAVALGVALGVISAPMSADAATTATAATAAATAATAKNTWHVAATLGLGSESTATSCPSTTRCWTLEAGELLSSADGGAGWTVRTDLVPSGISALVDLDCPSTSTCYLTALTDELDPVVLALDTDALAIDVHAVPGATATLETLSCAARRHCMTTDGHRVFVTHDGGQTWAGSSPALIVYSNPALDCVPKTSWCWLVGDNGETPIIERTTTDGKTWTAQNPPASPLSDGLYGVDCPTKQVCYVVGANMPDDAIVVGTKDSGQTWQLLDLPHQDYALYSVSCTSATTCWAAGEPPSGLPSMYSTADGQHWTAQTLPAVPTLDSPQVSCPGAGHCAAVSGGVAFTTTDGGAQWTSDELPAVVGAPQGLSCATRKKCVGVANDALSRPAALLSSDGGTTWEEHPMPRSAVSVWDVDCVTAQDCYAVSTGTIERPYDIVSHAWHSVDGGRTWKAGSLDDKRGILRQLTCPSTTTCLAGGFDRRSAPYILRTTDSGATWQRVTAPSGSFSLDGIACSSVTSCLVVTAGVSDPPIAWTTTDLGSTYQQHVMPDFEYYDVACGGLTCVAVGSDIGDAAVVLSTDGGVTWATQQLPRTVQIVGTVACGSPSTCAASAFDFSQGGGPLILGTTNTGRTWRKFPVPARQEQPIDVTCVGARCLASDVSLAGNPLVLAGRA